MRFEVWTPSRPALIYSKRDICRKICDRWNIMAALLLLSPRWLTKRCTLLIIIGSMHDNLQRQHPLLELPWGLLVLCRRTLGGSESHWYAMAWPDKLGTDPMAVGGISTLTPPRKSGGISWWSTRFSLRGVWRMSRLTTRNGTDGRTRLAKPNSQARTVTGKYEIWFFFLVQLTTSNRPVDPSS